MSDAARAGEALAGGAFPKTEATLRGRLGVPDDAARVLVFSESSHWDTNWLLTSEEYFRGRLEPIFEAVMRALEKDPERVYCIESVFFLRLFWERHPEAQARLRTLFDRRQLRILTSSFTTPDTLLPHPESILRDFHLGQEWLRANGLTAVPHTAYFPDNFGHSPHLPSLMRTVGVDAVAVTRIDGMYFIAADFKRKRDFPLKGSTAEVLQNELQTLDFVWKDDDGAEILCHWNAFTYFQGDMLAHAGVIRWNGHVAAVPWRTRGHIARRIDGFVRELAPLARTPYLLCPIGMDFNDPIDHIRELFDRYNRERYPTTGTWTVLAGMDDYFDLVRTRQRDLPVLAVDPNPYWMGFYSSRPELKQRPTRIARTLLLAESLSATEPAVPSLEESLREGWLHLVLMNHHDAITGTSPDRVCHAEQRDWLDVAEAAAEKALTLAAGRALPEPTAPTSTSRPAIRWRGRELHVKTAHHIMTFSKEKGGCLTSLVQGGREQLQGLGIDLVAYDDDGGLWRLGHEYRGGRFTLSDRASRRPAAIHVDETGDTVSIVIESTLGGKAFTRRVTCRRDDPFLEVHTTGFAGRRHTVTCRSELLHTPVSMDMDTIGGWIERPRERGHHPTFWPVPSRIRLAGPSGAIQVAFEAPTAVSFSPEHTLEWVVARNPMRERAFGLLPVLAHPVGGTVDERQSHTAAIFSGAELSSETRERLELAWLPPEHRALRVRARTRISSDDPGVSFAAVKRADVGAGVIVRLACEGRTPRTVHVSIPGERVWGAFLCDAREANGEALEIDRGQVVVPLVSRLTTVRLIAKPA